MHSDRQIICR